MRNRFFLAAVVALPITALADRFDDWDRNGDGKLQKSELPQSAVRNFERADANHDGVITREEDAAFMKRGRRAGPKGAADPGAKDAAGQVRILKDLDYVGTGNPRQKLDLFLPSSKTESPRPLLVFIHGGGWRNGSKEGGYRRLARFLESGDYAGASINYRLTGEAQWPAQIHDCKAAIRWLKAHAAEYGYDAGKIAVWGTSAGGHLVAMLGVSGDVPQLEGTLGEHLDQTSTVSCVVNYFGPSNLRSMDDHPSKIEHSAADSPEGKLVGGALANRKEQADNASPVTHVSRVDAPILIAHGTDDQLVPHPQSVELTALLQKVDVPVTFITMTGAGHGFQSAELDRRVSQFLSVHLQGREAEISREPIPMGK